MVPKSGTIKQTVFSKGIFVKILYLSSHDQVKLVINMMEVRRIVERDMRKCRNGFLP